MKFYRTVAPSHLFSGVRFIQIF